MRTIDNYYFMIFIFLFLFNVKMCPQNLVDSLNKSTTYLYAGIGYKYHFTKVDPYTYSKNEVYKNHYSFNFGVAVDFWGEQKHMLGLEVIGFPYVYGDHQISPRYFSVITSIFYRRNIFITNNIVINPAAGIVILSNDVAQMLAINFDLGLGYTWENYELFLRNNFRISPGMVLNTPWFL
ncbi:MAG: hypothetical protein AB1394_16325, partial [Bacteroidota bacterium]